MQSHPTKAKQDNDVEVELRTDNIDMLYAKMLKAGVNVNDRKKLDECIPTGKVEPVPVKKEHSSKVKVGLEKSSIEKLYAKLLKAGVNEAVLKDLDGGMLAESDLRSIEKLLDEKAMKKKLDTGRCNKFLNDSVLQLTLVN